MPKERKNRQGEPVKAAKTVPVKASRNSGPVRAQPATKSKSEYYTSDEDDEEEEEPEVKRVPFRFLDLPSELRLRVYEALLHRPELIDLDPLNYYRILPRLAILQVSRQLHEEAYRVFYQQMFRLFPMHERFFNTKKPLLMRLTPRYRAAIRALELRLGPGWHKPPVSQRITPALGLADCKSVRHLRIFVQVDPSEPTFAGFRGKGATESTYQEFCIQLLNGIFEQCPSILIVELDVFPAVRRDSPLLVALAGFVVDHDKILRWGPGCAWASKLDDTATRALEVAMAGLAISTPSTLVQAQA